MCYAATVKRWRNCAPLTLGLLASAAAAANPQPLVKLTPNGSINQYGNAMSMDGDTALVAAVGGQVGGQTGLVYAYTRNAAGEWIETGVLTSGGVGAFGASISLKDWTAVVGAPRANVRGPGSGSASIFRRGLDGLWTPQATLIGSDVGEEDQFGFSAAMGSGVAVVGALHHSVDDWGAAYVFT